MSCYRNKRLPQDPVDWKPNPKHLKYLEIPLFATLGMAVLSMVAYFAYVNGDEFAKGNADIKYIPFKSVRSLLTST